MTVDPHTGAIAVGLAQGMNGTGMMNAWDEVLSTNAEDAKRTA